MAKTPRNLFFAVLAVLVALPGCAGSGCHQESQWKSRRSAHSDAEKNARGGCSKEIRTKNNLLKPAALKKIFIGMKREQVVEKIGQPHKTYDFKTSIGNEPYKVFEYYLDLGDRSEAIFWTIFTLGIAFPLLFSEADQGEIETYWLYFYDNKLIQCDKVTTGSASSYAYSGTGTVSATNTNSSCGYSGTGVTGYGQISKTTGRVRDNVVSGYYRSNGTYVHSYARS